MLMREAAKENGWDLNYGGIALMWRGGCIIRSVFLGKIKEAFDKKPDLNNLLLDEYFQTVIGRCQTSWRRVMMKAVDMGVPVPAFSSALMFFDGYRSNRLPANLLHKGCVDSEPIAPEFQQHLDREHGPTGLHEHQRPTPALPSSSSPS
jgi:6-phosphogluconate dehydrogenase